MIASLRLPRRGVALRARRHWGLGVKAVVFLVGSLIVASFVVPLLIGDSVAKTNLGARNEPPWLLGGSSEHLFGTDYLGRDVLGRLLIAARISLLISISVTVLSASVGTACGAIAGYRGGWLDSLMMRLADVVLSFPGLLLAVVIVYITEGGVPAVVGVLAVYRWPIYTRVARAEAIRIRESVYVDAARALGYGHRHMMLENFLPNILPIILAVSAVSLAQVMLGEASLSFLGLGIQPPGISLGLMVAQGRSYLTSAWWLVVLPGLMIVLITFAMAAIANAVWTFADPRSLEGMRSDA